MTKQLLTTRIAFVVVVLAILLAAVAFANARLLAQGEPGSIPVVTLTSDNPGQLVISWEQPETGPSDYRISWTPDGQSYPGWQDENQADRGNAYPGGSARSHTVNGLPGGARYKVQMRARYNTGEQANNPWSGPWATSDATRVKGHPPDAPTGLSSSNVAHNTVTISWTAPASGAVTSYHVLRATDGGALTKIASATGTSHVDDTVSAETAYTYAVTAMGPDGDGAQSASIAVTPPGEPAPLPPQPTVTPAPSPTPTLGPTRPGGVNRLTLTSVEPGQLVITWTAPEADRADDYRVSWARSDQDWPAWSDPDGNAYPTTTTVTINGLDEGVEYKVRVRARIDQNTASPWSGPWSQAAQTVSAPPAGAPASPAGLVITLDYGVPVLSWDDPADDSVTGYRIRRGPHANDLPALVNDTGSVTNTYTDDTAQAGHAYVYAVQAINDSGASGYSGTVSVTPPPGPYNLLAVAGEEGVSLNWSAPDGATVTGYRILSGTSAADPTVLVDDTGSADTFYDDVSEREPGTVHYAVSAHVAGGTTPESAPVSVTIEDDSATETTDGANDETVVLVSNVEVSPSANPATVGDALVAQRFRTGPSASGYVLHTVHLEIAAQSGDPTIAVSIHASAGSTYGAKLYDLSSPPNLDADVDVFTAPDDATLQPDTDYWMVVKRSSESGAASLQIASTLGADDKSMDGFGLSVHQTGSATETSGRNRKTTALNVSYTLPAFSLRTNAGGVVTRTNGNPVRLAMNGQDLADVPASISSTVTLTVGQKHQGLINFFADHDWYPVLLEANKKYDFVVNNGTTKHIGLAGFYDSSGVKQTIHRVPHGAGQRAYFTPTSAGTYYLAAGVGSYAGSIETHRTEQTVSGEVVVTAHYKPTTTGTYSVSVFDADPETATIDTKASVSPGDTYHGEFFPPHNSLTDTDWIRLPMQQGQKYMLLLYGYTSIVDFRIMSIRDSSGAVVTGFTAVGSDQDRSGGGNQHWVTATFEPSTSGDYFVELTARAANYMKRTYTDTDIQEETVTQTLSDHDFHGVVYGFRVWSDGQTGKGEPVGEDTTSPGVMRSGHVATDNTDVTGAINAANDVDWYSVWLEADHQYLIMLEGGASLTGVREWPRANLDIFDYPKGGNAGAESASKCAFATYHAGDDGIHFIGIEGTATGSYSLTVLDTRSLASRAEGGSISDVGGCVAPGVLFPGAPVTGARSTTDDADGYLMWLDAGVRYRVDVTGVDAGEGTLPNPNVFVLYPNGTVDKSAVNAGSGDGDLWISTVTGSGIYLAWVHTDGVETGTYTIKLAQVTVIYEPGSKDLMPDGDRDAGLLATSRSLDGYLLEGDSYDGFRIDTKPGYEYELKISSRDTVSYTAWSLRGRVYRYDGTTYTLLDDSLQENLGNGNHYRDYSVYLNFEATTPPAGVTYTYHGEISAFGHEDGQQFYIGGYSIGLTETEVFDTQVSFSSSSYFATEGGLGATIVVSLHQPQGTEVVIPLTVSYVGGATSADHSAVPDELTFGASETMKTFTVTATDDSDDDDSEGITIGFGRLPDRHRAGGTASTLVTLVDND